MSLLASVHISHEDDRWVWEGSNKGVYSVKSAYALLTHLSLPTDLGLPIKIHVLEN